MIEICFYDRDCFPKTWANRLGFWLIERWSSPFVHVDVRGLSQVLTADLAAGEARLVLRRDWIKPRVAVNVGITSFVGLPEMHRLAEMDLHYGWLDFLMVPFRSWLGFDGPGVICSELTAEFMVSCLRQQQEWPLADALTRARPHTLTPQSLYYLLVDHVDSQRFTLFR